MAARKLLNRIPIIYLLPGKNISTLNKLFMVEVTEPSLWKHSVESLVSFELEIELLG